MVIYVKIIIIRDCNDKLTLVTKVVIRLLYNFYFNVIVRIYYNVLCCNVS